MKRSLAILLFALLAAPRLATAAPGPGALIKLACPQGAEINHACRAVYFYGGDGKRHAFPNDKVYFTWYADFAGVQTVDPSFMASLPLGPNVTYRPGARPVKFMSTNETYAVALGGTLRWIKSESAAGDLYGSDWNRKVDDISEAFFTNYVLGPEIASTSDFSAAAETASAPTINDDLDSAYVSATITTARGSFPVSFVKLIKSRFAMVTDTGNTTDCADGCAAKPLADYAAENGAIAGMHGSYFCPPDYADCAGKTYTFHGPVYNTFAKVMINAGDLPIHVGPFLAHAADGRYFYYHRTNDLGPSVSSWEAANGTTLEAAISNYPSLIENDNVIVESESRLDDGMKTIKGTRGGLGYSDRHVFLVVAKSATVVDLAYVMKALGATSALNLDGGGSAALWYGGSYKVGPGRLLPNAILFKKR